MSKHLSKAIKTIEKLMAKLLSLVTKPNAPVGGLIDPLADPVALAARFDGKTIEDAAVEIETLVSEVSLHADHLKSIGRLDESVVYYDEAHNMIDMLEDYYIDQRLELTSKSY